MQISYIGFSENLGEAHIYLLNDSYYEADISSVSLNGEDVTPSSEIKQRNLSPKDKTLLILRTGNPFEIGTFQRITVKTTQGDTEARVRVIEPFFPVGIYGGDAVLANQKGIQDVIAWGIDTLVADANEENLEKARKHSFKIIASGLARLPPPYPPGPEQKFVFDIAKVEKFKDHPAVLCWYVVDEPDLWENRGNIPHGNTEKWTSEVRRIDKKHPTYIVLCRPFTFERMSHIMDIPAVDPYPVTHLPLEYVSYMVGRIRETSMPKPVWDVPQAFRFPMPNIRGWWGWPRFPTPQEERLMVGMAIAHGAKGIIYFTYASHVDNPRDPVQGLASGATATFPLQDEIAKISVELHTVGPLLTNSDVLTGVRRSICNAGAIEPQTLLCGEDTLILAVSNHNFVSTDKDFKSSPISNVNVKVALPPWLNPQEAYEITSWEPQPIDFKKEADFLTIHFDEVCTTKLVVLTTDEDLSKRLVGSWRRWRR